MLHVKQTVLCGVCGESTTPLEDPDVDDGTLDDNPIILPKGWVQARVSRLIENPDFEAPEDVEDALSRMTEHIQAGPQEKAAAMAMMRPIAEASVANQQVAPQHIVEECVIHLCPSHSGDLIKLDAEAFDAAGWTR